MLDKSPSTSVTIFTQPNKESNRFKNSSNNINGLVYRSINTDLNFNGSPQTKHDDGHLDCVHLLRFITDALHFG